MTFPSVDDAQRWSAEHGKLIYVEIDGASGVLKVYPGGRKVFVDASMVATHKRWRKKLTPDSVFCEAMTAKDMEHAVRIEGKISDATAELHRLTVALADQREVIREARMELRRWFAMTPDERRRQRDVDKGWRKQL